MTLSHGKFKFGMSEREVAILLDALDAATVEAYLRAASSTRLTSRSWLLVSRSGRLTERF